MLKKFKSQACSNGSIMRRMWSWAEEACKGHCKLLPVPLGRPSSASGGVAGGKRALKSPNRGASRGSNLH